MYDRKSHFENVIFPNQFVFEGCELCVHDWPPLLQGPAGADEEPDPSQCQQLRVQHSFVQEHFQAQYKWVCSTNTSAWNYICSSNKETARFLSLWVAHRALLLLSCDHVTEQGLFTKHLPLVFHRQRVSLCIQDPSVKLFLSMFKQTSHFVFIFL